MIALAHLHIEAEKGPLSNECVDRGIISFLSLIEWVEQLPYQRNTDRSDYTLVLEEECGTCSTKNALIKAVAIENGWGNVTLHVGIFLISEKTHPGIGPTLNKYKLKCIPEAHSYLKIANEIRDVTGLETGDESFDLSIQLEEEIRPEQIGDYKINFHQDYLQNYAKKIGLSRDELWKIREECIEKLSQ